MEWYWMSFGARVEMGREMIRYVVANRRSEDRIDGQELIVESEHAWYTSGINNYDPTIGELEWYVRGLVRRVELSMLRRDMTQRGREVYLSALCCELEDKMASTNLASIKMETDLKHRQREILYAACNDDTDRRIVDLREAGRSHRTIGDILRLERLGLAPDQIAERIETEQYGASDAQRKKDESNVGTRFHRIVKRARDLWARD